MISSLTSIIIVLFTFSSSIFAIPRFFHGRISQKEFYFQDLRGDIAAQSGTNNVSEEYFTQRLDHFDLTETTTWNQRYYLNTKYYKAGDGPGFLLLGGEGPINVKWMDDELQWIKYGMSSSAIYFQLEHRFYGKSHPTSDLSTSNLKYLNSRQALADAANFISKMNQKWKIKSNKWIVFGGSYSGNLAAWMRLKYPQLVFGSIASSAPVQAVLDFSEYMNVVTNSLGGLNHVCVNNIQKGFEQLKTMIASGDTKQIQQLFRLDSALDSSNRLDVEVFYESVAGNFAGVVQYNRDSREFEGAKGTDITVDTLCGIMTNSSIGDSVAQLAAINSLLLNTYGEKSLDCSYNNTVTEMRQTSWSSGVAEGGRQWVWQTCTEFGYFQSSDSSQQPFGAKSFPLSYSVQQCVDIYGSEYDQSFIQMNINETNVMYGGTQLSATRIVLPNGSIDPWHALGITKSTTDSSSALTPIFIQGTAHCADMYPSSSSDYKQLVQARSDISKIISLWLTEPSQLPRLP